MSGPWTLCSKGSCHRHQCCMYVPCRAASAPAEDKHAPKRILTTRERKAWLTQRG